MTKGRTILAIIALFLACPLLRAQDFQYNANFVFPRAHQGAPIPPNTTISEWTLSWTVQGQIGTCALQVDTSTDGTNWTSAGLFGSQPCTAPSSVSIKGGNSVTGGFVRINVTALAAPNPADRSIGLNVSLDGWSGAF